MQPGETVGVAVPAPLENVDVPPPDVGQSAAQTAEQASKTTFPPKAGCPDQTPESTIATVVPDPSIPRNSFNSAEPTRSESVESSNCS